MSTTTAVKTKLLKKLQNSKSVISPTELIEALEGLKDEDSIKEIAQAFDAWIRSKYKTLKSVRKHMTSFLKPLRELPLVLGENAYIYENYKGEKQQKHLFQKYAGLTNEEYNLLNCEAELKKEQRLENGVEIEVQSYLERVEKLLLSSDRWELMAGIIAATGRRPHEIAARGQFELIDTKDLEDAKHQPLSHWLKFSGQGKKRGVKFAPYLIATLFPAEFMLKSLNKLRRFSDIKNLVKISESELIKEGKEEEIKKLYPKDSTKQTYEWEIAVNKKIDGKVNGAILSAVKKELSEVLFPRFNKTSISSSSLRAAYARLATARDCPKTTSDLLWAAKLLGHKKSEDLEALLVEAQLHLETTERREKIEVSDKGAGLKNLLTTIGYFDYIIPDKQSVPLTDTPRFSEKTMSVRGFETDVDFIKSKQEEWELDSRAEALEKIVELAQSALDIRAKQFDAPQVAKPQEEEEENNQFSQQRHGQDDESVTMKKSELLQLINQVVEQKLSTTKAETDPKNVNTRTAVKEEKEENRESREEKNWEDVPSQELRKSKAPGVAFEKCKRIVQAIMDYNNYKAASNDERWYIGIRSIQECAGEDGGSGLNYTPVKQFLSQFKVKVDDHNAKYGLKNQHNKRHNKPISKVIEW